MCTSREPGLVPVLDEELGERIAGLENAVGVVEVDGGGVVAVGRIQIDEDRGLASRDLQP